LSLVSTSRTSLMVVRFGRGLLMISRSSMINVDLVWLMSWSLKPMNAFIGCPSKINCCISFGIRFLLSKMFFRSSTYDQCGLVTDVLVSQANECIYRLPLKDKLLHFFRNPLSFEQNVRRDISQNKNVSKPVSNINGIIRSTSQLSNRLPVRCRSFQCNPCPWVPCHQTWHTAIPWNLESLKTAFLIFHCESNHFPTWKAYKQLHGFRNKDRSIHHVAL
jgi:hypothetical protein